MGKFKCMVSVVLTTEVVVEAEDTESAAEKAEDLAKEHGAYFFESPSKSDDFTCEYSDCEELDPEDNTPVSEYPTTMNQ